MILQTRQSCGDGDDSDDFIWSAYLDVVLLNSLAGVRPIGVSYQLGMLTVWRRFTEAIDHHVPLEVIEERLSTMFNFRAAAELGLEDSPPIDHLDEFALPMGEYSQMEAVIKAHEEQAKGLEISTTPKKSLRGSSADGRKTPVPVKAAKKLVDLKSTEKSNKKEEKKTPVDTTKKRGRLSERSTTPVSKRRN